MNLYDLQAYASTFVAFLIKNIKDDTALIKHIILFGSAAKGTITKESDIDIFINTDKKKIETKVKKILSDFYMSREALLFRAKGIENEIVLKVGKIEEWKDLHSSIMTTGLILWGKYKETQIPSGVKHMVIFYWEKADKNRGAFLNKLYGFTVHGKEYSGLITSVAGIKTGKSSILVPIEEREMFVRLFQKYNVHAKHIEVFVS
jgi:predicted nucleotidyltransferase